MLPQLMSHVRSSLGFSPRGRRIFVPGCGRGHEGKWLSDRGALVDGADYAPEAIAAARECYPETDCLQFFVQDVFVCPEAGAAHYDAIVDRAMLCAINPSDRRRYLDACATRLRPGGLFLSLAFEVVRADAGPPFAVSKDELHTLCETKFTVAHIESQPAAGMQEYISQELLVVLQRR